MKTIVALVALFAVAMAAAPARSLVPVKATGNQQRPRSVTVVPSTLPSGSFGAGSLGSGSGSDIVILKETLHNNDGLSGYQYNYELSDGSARDESAQVEVRGAEEAVLRVSGSFRFVALDGQTYTVTYVADENGFQPQGAHLPSLPKA